MIDDTLDISRGWGVLTTDDYRVGDVTEVHPTYLLVSRGLVFVNDTYVPLHAIERVEDNKVRLSITRTTFRKMDWKKPPRTPLELVRPIDESVEFDDPPAWDALPPIILPPPGIPDGSQPPLTIVSLLIRRKGTAAPIRLITGTL